MGKGTSSLQPLWDLNWCKGSVLIHPAWCSFNFGSNGAKMISQTCKILGENTHNLDFCSGHIGHEQEDFRSLRPDCFHLIVHHVSLNVLMASSRSQKKSVSCQLTTTDILSELFGQTISYAHAVLENRSWHKKQKNPSLPQFEQRWKVFVAQPAQNKTTFSTICEEINLSHLE